MTLPAILPQVDDGFIQSCVRIGIADRTLNSVSVHQRVYYMETSFSGQSSFHAKQKEDGGETKRLRAGESTARGGRGGAETAGASQGEEEGQEEEAAGGRGRGSGKCPEQSRHRGDHGFFRIRGLEEIIFVSI